MKNLSKKEMSSLSGGWWKPVLKAISLGASFILGKDVAETWSDGWNDPYGKD